MPKYNLLDFFPDCSLPNCPDYIEGKKHQHILPHQQEVFDCTSDYIYVQGGVGSGKSLPFAIKSVYLSMDIAENVGIVSRKDYKLMYKSCWLDIKACIKRLVQRGKFFAHNMKPEEQLKWYEKKLYSDKRQGDYTTITFPNDSIIYAMQGKAWEEGLGASYGWFWIDDAMESAEEMFIGNDTSAGLLSRLRLPHVHYHREHGTIVNRMQGMVSSNPPPVGHYLHKLFGNKPGEHKIGEKTVKWMMSATYDNPFVGTDYATGLIAVQSQMKRGANTARRVIFGESVPAYGGVKVFPEFEHEKHVAELEYLSTYPLVRGWDFGFHHPAVVYSSLYRCVKGCNHCFSLSETADCFSLNVWDFYAEVRKHTDTLYKDCCLILNGGDRAGYRKSSSNRDNRGDMRILMQDYNLPFKWRQLDLDNSLQYMRKLLKTKCECGLQMILISPDCKVLIGALEGGYKYSKSRASGQISEKPVEDRYFADVACAWRYGIENFVRFGVPFEQQDIVKQAQRRQSSSFDRQSPWEWMNHTDEEMAALISQ